MQLSNLALAYLVEELKPLLEGSIVRKVQELREHSGFKLKLQTRSGTKELVLANDYFFLSSHTLPVDEKPSNFTLRLKKFLLNKKILKLEQVGFERIVFIEFEGAKLSVELFHNGNLILLDKENVILSVLRAQDFADRTLRVKQVYAMPPKRGTNPLEANEDQLSKAFSVSKKTAISELLANVNSAPEFAEEAFQKTRVKKDAPANTLSKKDLQKVLTELKKLYTILPSTASAHKTSKGITPFTLNSQVGEKVSSINAFLDESFSKDFSTILVTQESMQASKAVSRLDFEKKQQAQALVRLEKIQSESGLAAQKIYENFETTEKILSLVNSLEKKRKTKEQIMQELKATFLPTVYSSIASLDLKKKEIVLDL